MAYCQFIGSYYDPAPWADRLCGVEDSVPAGCPIHFTDGSSIDPANVTTSIVAMNGDWTPIASTATIAASDTQGFSLMDVDSCDCHFAGVSVTFHQLAVDVPTAQPGDTIVIEPFGVQIAIGPAGACPTPDWPNMYEVARSCDICPGNPNDPSDPSGSDDKGPLGIGGCAVGGDPSLLLAAFGAMTMLGRFSRRTRR